MGRRQILDLVMTVELQIGTFVDRHLFLLFRFRFRRHRVIAAHFFLLQSHHNSAVDNLARCSCFHSLHHLLIDNGIWLWNGSENVMRRVTTRTSYWGWFRGHKHGCNGSSRGRLNHFQTSRWSTALVVLGSRTMWTRGDFQTSGWWATTLIVRSNNFMCLIPWIE